MKEQSTQLLPTGCNDHHCNVDDNAERTKYTNYIFPLSEVKEYYHEESGGAVHAINVQFIAINTTFNDSYSVKGGAGCVFIYNKIDRISLSFVLSFMKLSLVVYEVEISFKNVTFS